ncbi:YraN family protein [Myroides phaeus]|uniref:UPF0102 protein SAMN05421818_12117 n=1 Tax=Myroides phaeus TaxID=702745 RepID=A0A1G8G0G1_9FLAO|nr:YraN family protein [Myroides phaeus]MEC4116504.1 YraN family protein [Myroides phaeus]SDH87864.1 putative endonuclease [Myroides phaeus]
MAKSQDIGEGGEKAAVAYLKERGYDILIVNYVAQKGEIDIIALKDNILVFVEVKTRSSLEFGLPQDFVKATKIGLLVRTANIYIEENDREEEARFDIIAIHKVGEKYNIQHIEDAFYFF